MNVGNGNFENTVNTLESLTITQLWKHIDKLKTLQGIPELIGELIAKSVSEQCPEKSIHKVEHVIKLFFHSYGNQVLYSLQLRQCQLLTKTPAQSVVASKLILSDRMCLHRILDLKSLTSLDISHCTLITESSWLSMLGQMSLIHLSARSVNLTDSHITTLLACANIRKAGLALLEQLDLTGNRISIRSLSRLARLPYLMKLWIADNIIKIDEIDQSVWSISLRQSESSDALTVTNEGWLAQYLADTIMAHDRCSGGNFYKSADAVSQNFMMLIRQRGAKVSPVNSKRRCHDDCDEAQPRPDKKARRLLQQDLSESDLLSLYIS